jgi:hypothetical protein
MKLILASLYIAVSLACTFAQPSATSRVNARCALKPTEAPEIRGIRLGMALEKISQIFPKVKDAYPYQSRAL